MNQSPPADITLFGATGFTGRQIARLLARDNLPFRIAGRSADRLAALSAELPNKPAWLTADAAQPSSLPALFSNSRLLINCVGPFTDLGERVLSQAALTGARYLDITNELGYYYRARGFQAMAQRSGAALVPACGFEVALADCLANLAAAPFNPTPESPLDALDVVYSLSGQSSRGTRRSTVRSLGTSWIAYRDGFWNGELPGRSVQRFDFGSLPITAFSFPSCESITLPARLPVRRVTTWMRAAPSARFWAPLLIPLLARLTRSILRGLVLRAAGSGGVQSEGSEPRANPAPFAIYARALHGERSNTLALTGSDPYTLTAELIACYASEMLRPGFGQTSGQRGLLTPSQVIDPAVLIDRAQNSWGCTLQTV